MPTSLVHILVSSCDGSLDIRKFTSRAAACEALLKEYEDILNIYTDEAETEKAITAIKQTGSADVEYGEYEYAPMFHAPEFSARLFTDHGNAYAKDADFTYAWKIQTISV